MRRATFFIVCLAIFATASVPAHAADPTVMFGAYVEPPTGTTFVGGVQAFELELGRSLAIVNKFHDWSNVKYTDEAVLMGGGRRVMVSWHPTDGAGDPQRANEIVAGQYDALIKTAADAMKQLPGRVLLRFDFEMTQEPGQKEYIGTPSEFIAAWRHMYTIFQQRGATNVRWVWAPQAAGFTAGTAGSFWPGRKYVQWIEASDVMGGNYWPTFQKRFQPFYDWSAPTGKPLMAWVGLPEKPDDPNWKAAYLEGMQTTIESSMPAIKAVVYFSAATSAGTFYADTSDTSWAAFANAANDPYFMKMPVT